MSIFNVFIEKRFELLKALIEHFQISLISLLLAIIISFSIGVLIYRYKKASEILLQITGVFQTIPSLALLGIFIPFMGIGVIPAVFALVIYGIFPILQSVITGLNSIDPILEEAAEAFGMSKFEKLKKFEFALALPVIMSGIRRSSIMIIGTAILAAIVGAGGLGSFILLGIDRNNTGLILIGAISSALIAIIFGYLIKKLENKKPKVIFTIFLIVTGLVGLSFIPNNYVGNNEIVIAGKLGAEPEILINMYKILIENESDVRVEIKENFGKTTFLYEALKNGSIDIYPEFTGTILTSLLKETPKTSNDADDVYKVVKDMIYKQDKLVYLEHNKYQNTYALAVKKDFAKKYNLKNITDLKKIENKLVAGFTLEFNDREDGNIGLKKIYNLNLNVKTMEPSLRYDAIKNGDVNVIDVYSTDSKIITNDLVLLEDDKHLFPPYQAAPLIREEIVKKYPEIVKSLNKLSDKIDTKEMIKMNYLVEVEGKSAKEVALEYLKYNNLLDNK